LEKEMAFKDRFSFVRRRQAPEPVRRLPQPDSHTRVVGRPDSRTIPSYRDRQVPGYITPSKIPGSHGEWLPYYHPEAGDEDFSARYITPPAEWANEDNPDSDVPLTIAPSSTSNPARPRTRALGYNAETQTLRVKFRDGEIYDYHDVDAAQWAGISHAWSPGKWMYRNLPNEYTRIA
jgi:hypothetical protein